MVRELIQVLLEGRGNTDYASVALEPAVQAAFDDLDAAIDYGLHGLRAYAAVFSLWPMMTRAYQRIAETVATRPSINTPPMAALRESMQANGGALLKRTYLAHETWRVSREDVYADMYHQCGLGVSSLAAAPGLDVLLTPVWTNVHRQTKAKLQDILRSRFELLDATSEALALDLSEIAMDFLLREQAILRTAVAVQTDINRLLDREQPNRAISAADINVHNHLQEDSERLPYLIDELERLFGIHIDLTMDRLTITEREAAA
jgi:hypothetical protein